MNVGEICDANARYCHKCGSKTSFYQLGLLEDYTIEKSAKEFETTFSIPSTDDLPF